MQHFDDSNTLSQFTDVSQHRKRKSIPQQVSNAAPQDEDQSGARSGQGFVSHLDCFNDVKASVLL